MRKQRYWEISDSPGRLSTSATILGTSARPPGSLSTYNPCYHIFTKRAGRQWSLWGRWNIQIEQGRFIILISLEGLAGTMSFNYQLGAPVEQCQVIAEDWIYGQGRPLSHASSCMSSSTTLSLAYWVWESWWSHGQDPTVCNSHSEGQLHPLLHRPQPHSSGGLALGPSGMGWGQALSRPQVLPMAATSGWPDGVRQGCLVQNSSRHQPGSFIEIWLFSFRWILLGNSSWVGASLQHWLHFFSYKNNGVFEWP